MSPSVSRRFSARALRSLWSVMVGLLALVALSAPATAGAVTMTGTDPVDVASAPWDLTSAKVVYDPSTGKVTFTATTAASNAGVLPTFMYALIGKATGDQCTPNGETAPVVLLSLAYTSEGEGFKWVLTDPVDADDLTVTRSGTSITATTTDDSLKGQDFDCAQIQTKTETANAETGGDTVDVDVMNVFPSSESVVVVPPPVFTDQPDKDKDGVPDTKDKCPDVPGAAANGCLTIPDRLSIRLGAKRVVIDKLVARTAPVCPIKATVKVVYKKKTIGTGVVSVSTHGSFCRAYGQIRLKKSVKSAKITVKAKGMGSISATRKR